MKDEYGIHMDCEVSGGSGSVGEPSVTPGPSGLSAIPHQPPGSQPGPASSQVRQVDRHIFALLNFPVFRSN